MDYEEDGNRDILNGVMAGLTKNLTSPASDCNSNNLRVLGENLLSCSTDSTQDCPDFLRDNSEYQWLLDYGYKDNNYSHQSILSLSRSQDLIYYEDMARNIDANLAEVDMDNFNREDMHSVLSTLPNLQGVEEREMFASVSGSMMVKFDFDSSISPHSSSQEEHINCASICKSQLLFSPVHESYLPNSNLSVDSLDLSENDINLMVTCQANKNNYTIAFEGSTVMGSEDSESQEIGTPTSNEHQGALEKISITDQHIVPCTGNPMASSDSTFTTWSKIKEDSSENLRLRRHPSGNNNNNVDSIAHNTDVHSSNTVKSISMPDLYRQKQSSEQKPGLTTSAKLHENEKGEQKCIKLYDIQNSCGSRSIEHSTSSTSGNLQHNFNLVKLFIKQKSASHEGMSQYNSDQTVSHNFWRSDEKFSNETLDCKNCPELTGNNTKMVRSNRIYEMNKLNMNSGSLNYSEEDEQCKNKGKTKKLITNEKMIESHTDVLTPKNIYVKCNQNKLDNNNSFNCSKEIKYCSDESTQENGSNTESTENLMCHCAKSSPNIGNNKSTVEKSIQTSKLMEINENCQKKLKVPVYILYPNYSLPNLEFLKKKHYIQNIDFSKVFLRPQKYQSQASLSASSNVNAKGRAKRPFSVNDIETLKKTGFKHVRDWESLTFLLPKEYKEFLQEIPEIVAQLKDVKNTKEELVPLFCLSPPPSRRLKNRPISCEVNFFTNDSRSSNFSSTATQPSSGYRGSSTMLISNNSNGTNSPRNPSFSYKYDSHTQYGSSRRTNTHLQNKNHFSNNPNDIPPPRPPLPKSILRNNSLDNQQYTCKTQKENANKRYSMIELGDKSEGAEEKCCRRQSSQVSNLKSFQTHIFLRNNDQKQFVNDSESGLNQTGKGSNKHPESDDGHFPEERSTFENDMRRLEELLEISAVFGDSIDSFTESDMLKLRSQVSKFLTMQKNLEKVSETLQTVNEATMNGSKVNGDENLLEDVKNSHTPHNTPERKRQGKVPVAASNQDQACHSTNFPCSQTEDLSKIVGGTCGRVLGFDEQDLKFNDNLGNLRKTVSFAEKISIAVKEEELKNKERMPPNSPNALLSNLKPCQGKSKKTVDLSVCEESAERTSGGSPIRNQAQNSVVHSRKEDLVLDVRNAVEKILRHTTADEEDPARICLHHLCPSLYAVLIDGLKEEIDTAFGPIRNSVWTVIEASSQQGPMTQTLHELVQRLNRDDIFTEGLIKFNAFIFGLLNARALAAWFSYLRTRDNLLRKYYNNSGLLLMSNAAGAPVRILFDQLINIIETLSSVHFNLDLMYQTKLLHCSLQNLNSLLEEPANKDFLTPTKQLMLLKLVQSIQNSISQSGEGKNVGKRGAEEVEQKTKEPAMRPLLEKSQPVRARQGKSKSRPRSECDIVGGGGGADGKADIASAMKKRWSGVHLNSKLVEAFDKLGDESESDYTDSLDNMKPRRGQEKPSPTQNFSKKENDGDLKIRDLEADVYTKEQKKNILLNLNKKGCGRTDECKTEASQKKLIDNPSFPVQNVGHKFKRLQQKWEKLSVQTVSDSDSANSTPSEFPSSARAKSHAIDGHSCDTNTTTPSPTSRISKIPRLVTSPLSSAPTSRQTGTSKKVASPTTSGQGNVHHKFGKINCNNDTKMYNPETKSGASGVNRLNKGEDKAEAILSPNVGKAVTRPTSLSYRGFNTMPTKKSEAVSKRASSMSLNRKPGPKKLQNVQRTVRTLTHRLPSDSGHLSFNEGEKLKVVLEVDKTWLLCCRGSQKGLVPKSAVISDVEDNKF